MNSSLSVDADTLIVQVYLLATSQTSSSFNLVLSNLIPSGQSALGPFTSSFNSGTTAAFGNVNQLSEIINSFLFLV
jgi:hypothetical protein